MSLSIDYKKIWSTEERYKSSKLLECSIYENMVLVYSEIENHPMKEQLNSCSQLILKLFQLNNKYGHLNFCNEHFHNIYNVSYDDEDIVYAYMTNLNDLVHLLYDKLNLLVDDFMSVVEYNPNRVSFNNKTSVFLIAYATELKEIWELFNEDYINSIDMMELENKVYRNEFMKDKLKFVQVKGTQGVWAKGPIKF